MSISLLNLFKRKWYSRAILNGEAIDSNLFASVDAEDADVLESLNRIVLLLRQITTPAGTLRYSLTQAPAQVATGGQTAFTVAAYDNVNDLVFAYSDNAVPANGLTMITPASVVRTSATVVTIPAQSAGAQVVIEVFNVGNGTTQLASTSVNQGASLVGINDAGALLTATTVEGALQEIASNLASSSYLGGILTITNYLLRDGTLAMTGNLNLNSHKITNVSNGTVSGDAVNYEQLQAVITQQAGFSVSFLKTDGSNAMAANLDFGLHKGVNLLDGTAATDAVTKAQLDSKLSLTGGALSGALDMTSHLINNVLDPVSALDAANKQYVDGTVATNAAGRVLGGSSIDGAWTDADVPTVAGYYELASLTWASAHALPLGLFIRINGNVTLSAALTIAYASAANLGNVGEIFDYAIAGIGGNGTTYGAGGGGAGANGGGGGASEGVGGVGFTNANGKRPWLSRHFLMGATGGTNGAGTQARPGGSIIILINGNLVATGGTISVDAEGVGGPVNNDLRGGAGGGSILVACSGTLTGGTYNARGGYGGNSGAGGAGGGGGRVTLLASAFAGSRTGNVGGGAGSGTAGGAGLYEEITLTTAQIAALFDR